MMIKFMLDTNAYDAFIAEPSGLDLAARLADLVRSGNAVVYTTHIQEDELADIADKVRFDELRHVLREIPREFVPTAGCIIGISKIGVATIADEATSHIHQEIMSKSGNHVEDALIGGTAVRDADILVTNDKRLRNRLLAVTEACEVWTFDELREYLLKSKLVDM